MRQSESLAETKRSPCHEKRFSVECQVTEGSSRIEKHGGPDRNLDYNVFQGKKKKKKKKGKRKKQTLAVGWMSRNARRQEEGRKKENNNFNNKSNNKSNNKLARPTLPLL